VQSKNRYQQEWPSHLKIILLLWLGCWEKNISILVHLSSKKLTTVNMGNHLFSNEKSKIIIEMINKNMYTK
jgi:hypothetical protein